MNDINDTQELARECVEKIIQERKSRKDELKAKTEEKRVETVRHIWKWNTDKSKEPKIGGLPNEIWAHHFMPQLEDVTGMLNMWEAHPRFRDLSRESPAYVEHLLTQILQIENLPHLNLWKYDFLGHQKAMFKSLRMLSKTMRAAVDAGIEANFMKALRRRESGCIFYYITPVRRYSNMDTDVLTKILANFSGGEDNSPRANRVFHRSIKFEIANQRDFSIRNESMEEFLRKMTSLLKIVGQQIWHFSFRFAIDFTGPSITDVVLQLREWVLLMPNLKWLEIRVASGGQASPLSKEFFANHPFPRLEFLEKLTLGRYMRSPETVQVVSWVIQANLHIKILDDLATHSFEDNNEFRSLLSQLDLTSFCGGKQSKIKLIRPLVNTNWHLKYLYLNLHMGSLRPIFQFANLFPTLEHFSFWVFDITVRDKLPYLKLPKLTHFEMSIGFDIIYHESSIEYSKKAIVRFLLSLQFLLHCKMLKNLVWTYLHFYQRKVQRKLRRFMMKQERKKIVGFRGGLRDLTHSNIWDVFPELESVKKRFSHSGRFYEVGRPKLLQP